MAGRFRGREGFAGAGRRGEGPSVRPSGYVRGPLSCPRRRPSPRPLGASRLTRCAPFPARLSRAAVTRISESRGRPDPDGVFLARAEAGPVQDPCARLPLGSASPRPHDDIAERGLMNKVMTRAQRRPASRPPNRRDAVRPSGAPPRTPGGSPARTAGGARPPGTPRGGAASGAGPADNRPPASPGHVRTSAPAPTPSAGAAGGLTGVGGATPLRTTRGAAGLTGTGTVTGLTATGSASRTAPGGIPSRTAPGSTPSRTASGGTPSHTTAGSTPSHTAPGSTPSRTTAGSTPSHTTPGSASSHATAEDTADLAAARGAFAHSTTDVFAERLLAVLSGQRPVHWMLRHTAGRAYDELAYLAERGPLRTRGARPVVRDVGYYEARPGAVEVFARIGAGDRLRALAFRLERGRDLRWRCTAVELGGPRRPHAD
ncbi:Rv3235 family protein [Streptomyces sp. NPDC046985]|uniref:Rv3235 family protein n=1 Tax=Streptomyces sp. NPDC046985 TaxID=3155377 RepID=UPI0033D5024A